MIQITNPIAGSLIPNVLKTYNGGTGEVTANAALIALNGIPLAQLGTPLGPVQLGDDKKIDPNILPIVVNGALSIVGVSTIPANVSTDFTIDDYDSFITYSLTALPNTTVSMTGNVITFMGTTPGLSGFKINNKLISITVT